MACTSEIGVKASNFELPATDVPMFQGPMGARENQQKDLHPSE